MCANQRQRFSTRVLSHFILIVSSLRGSKNNADISSMGILNRECAIIAVEKHQAEYHPGRSR